MLIPDIHDTHILLSVTYIDLTDKLATQEPLGLSPDK